MNFLYSYIYTFGDDNRI